MPRGIPNATDITPNWNEAHKLEMKTRMELRFKTLAAGGDSPFGERSFNSVKDYCGGEYNSLKNKEDIYRKFCKENGFEENKEIVHKYSEAMEIKKMEKKEQRRKKKNV